MKLNKYALVLFLGLGTLTSCNDNLELLNPNQQTSNTFGFNADDLEESVIAAYNHIRMEGSYARVGYTIDVCRGDEAWNSSQVWYLPFDDLNAEVTSDITWWPWREWYYTVNVCNFAISRCDEDNSQLSEKMKRIKGQVLFLRGLSYYNLVGYYQNPPLITDYATYSSLDGLYTGNSTYDAVLDQVESDFKEAMELLPSRDQGGEWEKGRATCGAAAGYYARALMVRHKFKDALTVLKDIIGKKYGTYELMDNYGDNFREGPAYENNKESLFEVQFLDLESQGTDDEWTPVNTSPNATQGSAIESNFAPGNYGGWADISASPWLYHLFKAERTTDGKLDPRLYWTIGTYELMDNYGDNFREGPAYENNKESLFEVQFLDLESQGTDDEWTPVNTSPNATQGSAIESNFAPGNYGGWADISASPWLYHLFKAERTTDGKLDPRLYWTIGTYESDWEDFEYGNVAYTSKLTATDNIVTNNTYGGLPIAKFTNLRTGLYSTVITGLHDGINLRLMRYSDVLLRAAECENEVNGPTQQAIDWINEVRNRADLPDLELADFPTADKLFEQIANVERPKEFGCEFGRGFDLIRWGFFYKNDRLQQLKEHSVVRRSVTGTKDPVDYNDIATDSELKSSFDTYLPGHEFLPIVQQLLNKNPNLSGNSANFSTDNSTYFSENGWTVHPVVDLSK